MGVLSFTRAWQAQSFWSFLSQLVNLFQLIHIYCSKVCKTKMAVTHNECCLTIADLSLWYSLSACTTWGDLCGFC